METQILNVVIQGGSFGLLCYFLVFGVPRLIDCLGKQADKRDETFRELLKDLTADFKEDRTRLMEEFREDRREITASIDRVCARIDGQRRAGVSDGG
ncbi:MAG: hypothetical protein AMXMBFR58_29500 [Phycisphaerae bacterium]